MSKKQLVALFLCSLVPWTVGNGLIPLLPVYAVKLGADPAVAGYYLAFSYLALALGTVAAGWLSDKLQRRKALLIVAGIAGVPTIWLMGRATDIWQLTALTATLWFCGGVGLAITAILTGLFAEAGERGKVFGILSLTGGLGALVGGLTTGPIADRWGYPAMFAALTLFLILWPLAGMLLKDKKKALEQEATDAPAESAQAPVETNRNFLLLFLASFIAAVASFVSILGRSLAMDGLEFPASAIASTGAIGGGITLPLLPLIGWLSDRVGRKQFLALSYVAGAGGLLILAVSASLWHFWIAAVLLAILPSINGSVGSAWVADLVDQVSLGRRMALFSASGWLAGVAGFAGAGYAVQTFGMIPTLVGGACLALMAIVLLLPIRQIKQT